MQYSLFDLDELDVVLQKDHRLDRGEFFTVTPQHAVFINRREGVTVASKRIDDDQRRHEVRHCISRLPILPIEVLRWDANLFYVRLLYAHPHFAAVEKIISLEAILENGMPQFTKLLQEEGIILSKHEATLLGKVLTDVVKNGTRNGSIKVTSKVSRREWVARGITLEKREAVAALKLVSSGNLLQ